MSAQSPLRAIAEFFAGCVKAWDRFWFKPADPTTLGLMRIFCGLIVLYIHVAYTFDFQAFFGPHAWIDLKAANEFRLDAPNAAQPFGWKAIDTERAESDAEVQYKQKWGVTTEFVRSRGQHRWSIWYHVTDPTWMALTHSAFLGVMVLFTIGLFTRVTGVLTWIAMLSYIHRAPTVLFGVDTMMNLCVVYLIIGPSGAAFSMDQWLRRYWAKRRAAREGLPAPVFGPPAHQVSANFALRLLQINVCLVYFISGLSKMQGASWLNGTAVWGVMANYEFSPMRAPLYLLVLRIMCEHRWLWELVITSLTFFTLAFEISFIYLIWSRRMRWTMIVAAVFMHLGIAVCMGLVTFSMMTLVLVLSFVPAPAIRQLVERFAPRAGTLAFDSAQTNGHSLKTGSGTAGSFRASTRV